MYINKKKLEIKIAFNLNDNGTQIDVPYFIFKL